MAVELSKEEVEEATKVFNTFDRHNLGRVKLFKLSKMLEAVGIEIAGPELAACRTSIDDEGTRQIRMDQFLDLLRLHKSNRLRSESDMLGAFVACGGAADGSGEVNTETMSSLIEEFGLNVDLSFIKNSIAVDPNGNVSYDKFQTLLDERAEKAR